MTRAGVMVVVLLLAAGCGLNTQLRRAPAQAPEAGDWGRLRDAASRRATLYDGLVHRANASATWFSPPVRESSLRLLAEWQAKSEAETELAVAKGRADDALGEEFVVALYTADRRANDLDSKKSIWHVELDDGQVRMPATEITGINSDANLRQLLPYLDPFDLIYRVRVVWTGASLQGRPFKLRISGGVGALVLDFGPDGSQPFPSRMAP
jgi:hypothetical protein